MTQFLFLKKDYSREGVENAFEWNKAESRERSYRCLIVNDYSMITFRLMWCLYCTLMT